MGAAAVTGGRTTWAQARTGPLGEATCLWQDLDGLHIAPAPPDPPPTSILWGWTTDGMLLRARLDGNTVHLACLPDCAGMRVQPWSPQDNRIGAYRPAPGTTTGDGPGTPYVQVVVPAGDERHGPITFLRPARADDA